MINTSRRSRFVVSLLVVFALLLCSRGAQGQNTVASLQATVSDSSQAKIAGAQVTITNVETGISEAGSTDATGLLSFPRLAVGEYRLTIEKEGFARYVRSGITLSVGQAATVDVTLQLGKVTNEVSVNADANVVDTLTSGSNQLVDDKQTMDLPLNGRNTQSLLQLAAGTADLARNGCVICGQGGVYPNEATASVNGALRTQVNYQMDGVSHNDTFVNSSLPFPNPDAVQQFALQSSNFSAEYGNAAGGVVNIIAKSGTNNFHGSAFDFLRNGSLNAKNYFGTTHDTLHRNQFGGTIGGPILKDKLFFFGTYQGTPVSQSTVEPTVIVPTAAERSGDFSSTPTQLHDPVSGLLLVNNQIPSNRLDQVAQNFLKYVPLPNRPNGQLTFVGPVLRTNDNQFLTKIDYSAGKHLLSGHYFFTQFDEPAVIPTTNILAAQSSGDRVRVQTVAISHTYLQSATLLFNTTFGLNMQHGGSISSAPFSWANLGAQLANPTPPELELSITGGFKVATSHDGEFDRGDFTIREDVTKVIGKHELHLGGQALHVTNTIVNDYSQSGDFVFNGQLSGNGLADFLFGSAYSFSQGGGEFKNFSGTQWALFAQDNWKATSSLTLNAGLRWDPWLPYYDHQGRVVCFVPGETSLRYVNAPAGLVFGGSNHDAGCPVAGMVPYLPELGPRAGFAYRLTRDGSASIRGGFGVYYTPIETTDYNGAVDTAPFSPTFTYSNVDLTNPYGNLGVPNPFPAQYGPTLPGPNVNFTLPVTIAGSFNKNFRPSMVESWNLILEHQLGKSAVGRLAYIGSNGSRLSEGVVREMNPAIYVPGASTIANTQSRRAYSNLSSVSQTQSSAISNYNGLQVSFEKRIKDGLTLLSNYTWSKSLDNLGPKPGGWSDPFTRALDYGRSTGDLAHNFKFSNVWDIPNHHFQNKFVDRLGAGWQTNAIVIWQSGFPMTVVSGVDNSFSGVGLDHAAYLGGPFKLSTSRSHAAMVAQWFDTSRFAPNAVGTFGDSAKGQLRGPRYFDSDVAVVKNTLMGEGINLQIRAEGFNVFNNVNFTPPNVTQSSAQFGAITSALDPRILQLSAKIIF